MYSYYKGEIFLKKNQEYSYFIKLLEQKGWIKKIDSQYCWVDEEGEPIVSTAFTAKNNRIPLNSPLVTDIHYVVHYALDNYQIDREKTHFRGMHINDSLQMCRFDKNKGVKNLSDDEIYAILGVKASNLNKKHIEDLEEEVRAWVNKESKSSPAKKRKKLGRKI